MTVFILEIELFRLMEYKVAEETPNKYILKCIKGSYEGFYRNLNKSKLNTFDKDNMIIITTDIDMICEIFKQYKEYLFQEKLEHLELVITNYKNGGLYR